MADSKLEPYDYIGAIEDTISPAVYNNIDRILAIMPPLLRGEMYFTIDSESPNDNPTKNWKGNLPVDTDEKIAYLIASFQRTPTQFEGDYSRTDEDVRKKDQVKWKREVYRLLGYEIRREDWEYAQKPLGPNEVWEPTGGNGWNGGDWPILKSRYSDRGISNRTPGMELTTTDRIVLFTHSTFGHYHGFLNWDATEWWDIK